MRAVFFEAARTMTVRDVPMPEPGPGEVRLAVRACGICGSDLTVYKTGALAGPDVVLGHEIAARVDLDPDGRWPAGARVVPFPARACGRCRWCRDGQPRYCLDPPYGAWGGFAESVVYPSENLIPIPDGIDDRAAALAEPLGVAIRAAETAGAGAGELAYVSGLGSIGLLAVAALAAAGCRVVGGDPREDRRTLGQELGCDAVLDPARDDPQPRTADLDPRGPRIVLDCSGSSESLQRAFDVCAPGGVVGVIGVPMAPVTLLRMFLKEQRSYSLSGPSMDSMRRALGLLRDRPQTARVITAAVPLEDAGAAFEGLAAGDGNVKILVTPADV